MMRVEPDFGLPPRPIPYVNKPAIWDLSLGRNSVPHLYSWRVWHSAPCRPRYSGCRSAERMTVHLPGGCVIHSQGDYFTPYLDYCLFEHAPQLRECVGELGFQIISGHP